jgi:hypothetical protein
MKTKTKICDFPDLCVGGHVSFKNGPIKGYYFGRVMEQHDDGMILVGMTTRYDTYSLVDATWEHEDNLTVIGAFSEADVKKARKWAKEI